MPGTGVHRRHLCQTPARRTPIPAVPLAIRDCHLRGGHPRHAGRLCHRAARHRFLVAAARRPRMEPVCRVTESNGYDGGNTATLPRLFMICLRQGQVRARGCLGGRYRSFSRFRPGARRRGDQPFDGHVGTSPADPRQPRQIQAQW
jgi:hypothetical protein